MKMLEMGCFVLCIHRRLFWGPHVPQRLFSFFLPDFGVWLLLRMEKKRQKASFYKSLF
jgi:hypothetical protein